MRVILLRQAQISPEIVVFDLKAPVGNLVKASGSTRKKPTTPSAERYVDDPLPGVLYHFNRGDIVLVSG